MKAEIRPARVDDAEAMGNIQVRAWQAAYRGVMPDDYLDGLRAEDRAAMWRDAVSGAPEHQRLDVIVVGDDVVGFATAGREAGEPTDGTTGELYAMNLEPDHWGHGFGRELLRHVASELADAGYRSAVLWVAVQNARARRLYESEGWIDDHTERDADVLGVTVTVMRYRSQLDD